MGAAAAEARLGADMPTGRGVVMGHVEGGKGSYLPNTDHGGWGKVLFVRRSGPSEVNGHANATARIVYGPNGVAPGVGVVHVYSSSDWLGPGYLNAGSAEPPADELPRVFNHSWISGTSGPQAAHVLRRLDWQVDERDVIMCVGVNNNAKSSVPPLLGSAYNAIAVGSGVGTSSGGYTKIEVEGRCKPDIAGHGKLTSFTTPVIAGLAARLVEFADRIDAEAHRGGGDPPKAAARAETIKAVILAGATKPDGWAAAEGHPLDEHYGAGVAHLDRSLRIFEAGRAAPARHHEGGGGWAFEQLAAEAEHRYTFELTEPAELSLVLTWHRRVFGKPADVTINRPGQPEPQKARVWVDAPMVADLDVELVRLGEGEAQPVAASASRIDNVEHIYVPKLEPGRYAVTVKRLTDQYDQPWDYALAWLSSPEPGQ